MGTNTTLSINPATAAKAQGMRAEGFDNLENDICNLRASASALDLFASMLLEKPSRGETDMVRFSMNTANALSHLIEEVLSKARRLEAAHLETHNAACNLEWEDRLQ